MGGCEGGSLERLGIIDDQCFSQLYSSVDEGLQWRGKFVNRRGAIVTLLSKNFLKRFIYVPFRKW